jgi:hypothetical protein
MSPAQIAKAERLVEEYETVLSAQLRNARMASPAQDVVPPSPPLPQRSSMASPGTGRTLADVARRQLAFDAAGAKPLLDRMICARSLPDTRMRLSGSLT